MAFAAVLDTCVIYPAHLRDALLRLAERGLYRPLWSADILEELRRNLTEVAEPEPVDRLLDQMATAFPDAAVTGYQSLIDGLRCDPKDRHVLAAAVRANSGAIITFNTIDFPDHSTDPYAIEIIDPDTFLLDLLDLAPRAVLDELSRQAAANRRAPRTLPQILTPSNEAACPRSLTRSAGEPPEQTLALGRVTTWSWMRPLTSRSSRCATGGPTR